MSKSSRSEVRSTHTREEIFEHPLIEHHRREQIRDWFQDCRAQTLALLQGLDDDSLCQQAHPDFSPVGWHFGHIAYTESLWLLERSAGLSPLFPQYQRLFVADGLPKGERTRLPKLLDLQHYLKTVRTQVLDYLDIAPLDQQEPLWRWMLQHESQHSETIALVLELLQLGYGDRGLKVMTEPFTASMVEVPAGYFLQGNDSWDALDNERPMHRVFLPTYWIDRYPVTWGEYQVFMAAGGYEDSQWWSRSGWAWLQANPIQQPLYMPKDSASKDSGLADATLNHPVCGVSGYESEAYARFVGKRLPTEAEWEKAASWHPDTAQRHTYPWGETLPSQSRCNHGQAMGRSTPVNAYPDAQSAYGCWDMLGNVWEWTASWFDGYNGFVSYPYKGYSQAYFDGEHRVLKGGSWATRSYALRSSFRNWYYPGVRQIFAGFRCASDRCH